MTKSLTEWVQHHVPPFRFGSWLADAQVVHQLALLSMVALCLVLTACVLRTRDVYRASGWHAFFGVRSGLRGLCRSTFPSIPLALLSGFHALRQAAILLSLLAPLIYIVHSGGWSFSDPLSDFLIENY
jgi:hypothetical protein